ncbi:hypothetical protein [Jiulongibacter sediminis]|uniref:Uncharacterized protein n=1 Tax=Jiulongibacter sediminis TaxID=1605367 RepID=A0A0P7BM55_9BACT|nr:hypothetical protein [Jiulongibacter sediminis]KPM48334.1 hypothetical protein AFM12_06700 [Jiulongibacter sediminis]TBX24871.1 hypothetical protein TK44_06705 [Jiulongibacter sediminis]
MFGEYLKLHKVFDKLILINLIVSFSLREHRDICTDNLRAGEIFGNENAVTLGSRIADLFAAECWSEVMIGNPRIIETEDGEVNLILDFGPDLKLVMVPILKAGESKSLNAVTGASRIKIIQIGHV